VIANPLAIPSTPKHATDIGVACGARAAFCWTIRYVAAQRGINDDVNAVWIMEVDPQGAAAEAGIKKGDAILKVNDVSVTTGSQLSEQIARQKPGDKVRLVLLRDGKEKNIEVVLKNKLGTFASQKSATMESLGADFSEVSKENAEKLGIPGGVQVSTIRDGIIGNQTNMRPGFVITRVGGITVKTIDEMKEALSRQSGNFQLEGVYPGSSEIYYYGINDFKK
jgi:S1-C subfamily serine protease